ncbi:ERF family protein [Lactobacillus hominis]|uniref:Orf223 n=1 Tax=Lactobacillus hominis DSM 23910 = CRBIP 24.179 TaxID=1423758 RepID=I7LA73_9LACO|nr:ERF family protein [Lactobacillus hominis]KRM85774.1 Erf family protein [Lactobacillus hominis DSM 23910 = CRBIP 24.179]MCT3347180.1 hypothetical protein [Lactobacillus hominis]CCI82014.1 Orf223 [Lactobacillus hominis DSM 23910 = CRBIP 24.179]
MEIYGKEEDRASWALHYAQVKANVDQPQRKHTVTVSGKTKQGKPYSYDYKYADLADVDKAIMDGIKKVTNKEGNVVFSYFFDINAEGNNVTVQTVLIDITGFTVKTNKVSFQNNKAYDAQATASLISYAKRYSLSGAFGIAADDDDDARDQKVIEEPKVLTKQELEDYKVYYNGIQANLFDLYQEAKDGVKDAQAWFKEPHTPQDAQAAHQVAEIFKREEKKKRQEEEKNKQKDLEQAAKKVTEDPFKDKKVDKSLPKDIENLFEAN